MPYHIYSLSLLLKVRANPMGNHALTEALITVDVRESLGGQEEMPWTETGIWKVVLLVHLFF